MTCINQVDFRSPPERKQTVKLTNFFVWRFNKLCSMFKSLLMIFTYITTVANIGCAVEKRQIRLTTASRCIPTTKKMHRSPERPLSTSCLIWLRTQPTSRFRPWCRRTPTAQTGAWSVANGSLDPRLTDAAPCVNGSSSNGATLACHALVWVSGALGQRSNSIQKVEPFPSIDLNPIVPPSKSANCFEMLNPRPLL